MSEFVDWLTTELRDEGWSYNELARRAGLSSGGVSLVMTQRQRPGLEFCRGVARALDEAPERVLRLAGLLPRRSEKDESIEQILFYYDQMTPHAQRHFRQIARALSQGGEGIEEEKDADRTAETGETVAPA